MIVRFWGVRGSTPTPSTANLKYGGNTPCVEVRTSGGQLIVLDAGTGIRALGQRLAEETPPEGHRIMLFLSHYHWDHIQGIPFFEPLYAEGNFVYLHGFKTSEASIEKALGEQMSNPFFPVDPSVMKATRDFCTIGEETLQIGDAKVTTRSLFHPQGCMGYRIEADDQTLVYATDNEHGSLVHDRNIRELAAGADVVIYDTQYTPEEYSRKRGWGHSTWQEAVKIAKEVDAKHIVMFHHDPDHSDMFIDHMIVQARRCFPGVLAALEGMELDLLRLAQGESYQTSFDKRYLTRHVVALPVCIRIDGQPLHSGHAAVQNISLDGAYFLSGAQMTLGEEVEVELQFPGTEGGESTIRTKAHVMRCERIGDQYGIGVSFR
jgi:phosphoribosyl 1,2-cyclic phosphodiesterase